MSVTSSETPLIVENSCATPSIRTDVTAAPGERRQQHAAQRVAERVAEAAIERLDGEGAAILLDRLGGDSGDLEVEHQGPNVSSGCGERPRAPRMGRRRAGSQRKAYLEYSSTMSCSCTGAAISARSGLRSTFAVSAS